MATKTYSTDPEALAVDDFAVEIVLLDGKEVEPDDIQNQITVIYKP